MLNAIIIEDERPAMEMLVKALQTGTMPQETTLTRQVSIPSLDILAALQENLRVFSESHSPQPAPETTKGPVH